MQAGKLDRSIVLESRTVTGRDPATGEDLVTWTPFAAVWAEKRPVSGREVFAAQQEFAISVARWRIRWRSDINTTMRINESGTVWNIRHIGEIGRREGLELLAEHKQ